MMYDYSKFINNEGGALKEFEVHGSVIPERRYKTLDELFKEAQQDGTLYE